MTKTSHQRTTPTGIATRLWSWLRAVEEAASRDPNAALLDRIEILDSRLQALEVRAAAGARTAANTRPAGPQAREIRDKPLRTC